VVPKHSEKSVDVEVDRRWLDTTGVEGLDNDAAGSSPLVIRGYYIGARLL
jgi:hypothetical protein